MTAGPGEALPGLRGTAGGHRLAWLLAHGWRVRVLGRGFVPRTGPVLLAANHTGWLDGPLLLGVAPRPVHLLAKRSLFTGPGAWVLPAVGQVPIVYEGPDRSALRTALGLLADGRAVGLFPEAHRGRGDFSRFRDGVAYLAARSGAPIVPVAILGTRRSGSTTQATPLPGSRLEVAFGRPFVPEPALVDPLSRAGLAAWGEQIRVRLADHVARAVMFTGSLLPEDDPAAHHEVDRWRPGTPMDGEADSA